jgi:hypothetical protein
MMNAVIAIYLAKLFGAVLGVMSVGCVFERPDPTSNATQPGGQG